MKKRRIYLSLVFIAVIIISIIYLPECLQNNESTPEPLVKLYLSRKNQVIELKLEDYLIGTVAAEMPASFDIEALKAQAVCARTYAVRKIVTGRAYPDGADLSDDITCCQAYRPEEEYRKIPQQLQNKIAEAVKATRGEIILYKGEPIDALYHSTCGGQTESASDAWTDGCPYLKSIHCKYCSRSPYSATEYIFPASFIAKQFGQNGKSKINMQILQKTASGRVKSVKIGTEKVSGERLRNVLGLPSTCLTIVKHKNEFIISCRGYGHGVGMCQYGADGLARAGQDYRQILKTYYCGIDIYKLQY